MGGSGGAQLECLIHENRIRLDIRWELPRPARWPSAKMNKRMSKDLKDIAAQALELPLTARAELASQLLDSLDDLSEEENDQLWAQEAERRYAEYKAGKIEAVPADEVFARLRSRKK